jgi:formate hydrogenlyase subunit 6/NADH:ubiquinone oxidoreductase subunit I
MDFGSFVEGPLLWIVSSVFITGVLARVGIFFSIILKGNNDKHPRWRHILATLGRSLLPFHNAVNKKPIYATLRYIFHICLIVVPIWLSGHIILWEESRFGWTWTALPDVWADWMTLLLLFLTAYFLIRRIVFADIRLNSSKSDYLLIAITALPFMTGYLLTHGNLDHIPFLGDNVRTIHALSGEAMLIVAVFLFYRTQLSLEKCTGCAACELDCPTGTIKSNDEGRHRIFAYSHYQCICCGACVNTCPEEAAELRHEIGLGRFFQIVHKKEIRSIELEECEKCGAMFAPTPQIEKIGQVITENYIHLCSRCKKVNYAETFHQLAPWPKKLKRGLSV